MIRRQIKERIQSLLKGHTRAGEHVFIGKSAPTGIKDLPAILIYSPSELLQRFNEAPKSYLRTLSISIECLDKGVDDDDLDIALEDLNYNVFKLMEQDESLGCLVDSVELSSVDMEVEDDIQSPTGAIISQWNVFYLDDAKKMQDECLDDFQGANLDWKLSEADGNSDVEIDAEDNVDLDT